MKKVDLQLEASNIELKSDDSAILEADVASNQMVEKKETTKQYYKTNELVTQDLETIVCDCLRNIGIRMNNKGYSYLKEALTMVVKDYSIISSVTKVMYPTIAETYDTTPLRVERAIRHAIEVAWFKGNLEFQQDIFGYVVDPQKGKPTNSEFIAGVAEHIRLLLKKSC
ncbi:MAG: hypothetical protein HFJ47_04325 [Clostridia bacterium]|nr:hypothetical protein [Clostridia bacterium]